MCRTGVGLAKYRSLCYDDKIYHQKMQWSDLDGGTYGTGTAPCHHTGFGYIGAPGVGRRSGEDIDGAVSRPGCTQEQSLSDSAYAGAAALCAAGPGDRALFGGHLGLRAGGGLWGRTAGEHSPAGPGADGAGGAALRGAVSVGHSGRGKRTLYRQGGL